MATSRETPGPTPAGGVKSAVYFLDAYGNLVDEGEAVRAEVVEIGADGEQVGRTVVDLDELVEVEYEIVATGEEYVPPAEPPEGPK